MKVQQFNIFENLHLTREVHTSLLYRLINEDGKHSQNDLFLKVFIEEILKGDYVSNLSTEMSKRSGKKWNMDLFIGNDDHAFIIDNKIRKNPSFQNELYSYWRNEIFEPLSKKGFKRSDLFSPEFYEQDSIKDHYKIIYLTLDGKMKPQPCSIEYSIADEYRGFPETMPCPITYISYKEDIYNWVQKSIERIEDKENNTLLLSILEQYSEWIKRM